MSGSEMQREKEKVAAKMREKQAAGMFCDTLHRNTANIFRFTADAKKAAETAAAGKK
jgi:hypothetical protein